MPGTYTIPDFPCDQGCGAGETPQFLFDLWQCRIFELLDGFVNGIQSVQSRRQRKGLFRLFAAIMLQNQVNSGHGRLYNTECNSSHRHEIGDTKNKFTKRAAAAFRKQSL